MTLQKPHKLDQAKIELIRSTIAKDATNEELQLFLYHCERTGLDPLAKQIYFQRRYNKRRQKWEMTVVTGIDGYRLIADRTGQYAGNDDPIFDSEENPKKATVTVYRIVGGMRCPFTASARWDQYYPGDEQGFMWRRMPHLMLGKCAEALALRKAFPQELSGIYVREEMEQANSTHDDAQQRAIDVQKRIEAQTEEQQRERTRVETIRKHLALEGIDEKHWNEIISRLPVGSNLADLRRVAAEITAKE